MREKYIQSVLKRYIIFDTFFILLHLGNETSEFQVALICRERQAGTGVKGSQIDDEEPREEKEEKDWKMRPIAFQVLI